ncbi:MAG: FAD-dependent oxidoreductase [bacterium]|nr:FAD-dependent oxidoreductase [bacterium]
MTIVDHLIIGGGITGTTAAEMIRKHDPNATITIVSEEPHPLYSRVLLPHYIQGKIKREFVFLKKDAWYSEHHINLLRGGRMKLLRPNHHEVILYNGTEYRYRKLLLATGGMPKTLPFPSLQGISYFRTLEDADAIIADLEYTNGLAPEKQVGCIFGGGFIALEYCLLFRKHDFTTHLLYRSEKLWGSYFDDASEQVLKKILTDQDIHLHPHIDYVTVEGSKRLTGVRMDKQFLPCALLGVGIGLAPNAAEAAEAGIETATGIKVNEYFETNAPDVYAAGDAAEFYDVTVGRHRLIGNWTNAQQHGMHAAKVMTGERVPFSLVSSYSNAPFGKTITFIGDVARLPHTTVIGRAAPDQSAAEQVFIRDERIVGATLINMNRDRAILTKLIQEQRKITGQESVFADITTDLAVLFG